MSDEAKKFHEEEETASTYDLKVARRLFTYLRPYWKLVIAALALTLFTNVLVSLQPYFTKVAVDDFIAPKRTDGIWLFSLAFFGVFLFRFLFSYVQEILLNNVGQRVMFDLRTQIFTKLQKQELAYYDKYPVGRIITRLTSDVDALNELFTSGVIDVLGDLVVIFAILGIMFWLDWKLALVSLITIPLLFTATNWFRKHARRGFDRVRTRNAKLNAFLQEYISGAQTVQLMNAEDKAKARFAEINDDYRNANIETIYYYAIFYPLVDLIGAIGIALVIFFFGYETISRIRRGRDSFNHRDIGVVHSVFAAALSADTRSFRQVQRSSGSDRCRPPDIRPFGQRHRRHVTFESETFGHAQLARSNFVMSGSHTKKTIGCSRTSPLRCRTARASLWLGIQARAKQPSPTY